MKLKLRVIAFTLFASLLASTFSLTTTSLARAQMSDGEKKAAARAAYQDGVDLQDKGKPADALGRFEAAEKLFDAPTHLLHIAECQALTGKLVEASETYETLVRKTLPAGSPDAFVQAQEQSKAESAALRQRIPTLKVTIKPDPTTLQNLQININDKQMPAELVGIARPVNPGKYKLSATATGFGTQKGEDVDVAEKDAKSIELTLVAGGTGGVVIAGPTDGSKPPPPPFEQPKDNNPESPSSAGLLVGLRPAILVPVGDVQKSIGFDKVAGAGPGVALDLMGRLARIFLVGGTLEISSLGAPAASNFPTGEKVDVSTTAFYIGVLGGVIVPNVDKVAFVADAGLGERILTHSETISTIKSSSTYSGLEFGLGAGVSIPAGPIRIVPKVTLQLGAFSDCKLTVASGSGGTCVPDTTGTPASGATAADTSIGSTSIHAFLGVSLGIYYHVDFSKKSASAATPFSFSNSASN